jgi:hypothetical protein
MGPLTARATCTASARGAGQIDRIPDQWPVLIQLGEQLILDQQSHPYASCWIRVISRISSSWAAASPCCSENSASPWTEVSGVRSSWLASAPCLTAPPSQQGPSSLG